MDFGDPLLPDILKGSRADHTEAKKQGVGPAVAKVAEFVEFILLETKTYSEQCSFMFAKAKKN